VRYRRPKSGESWPSPVCAEEVAQAYADWFREYDFTADAPWAHFVTLTFRHRIHPEQAAKQFDRFLGGCTRGGVHRVRWARATERQGRGVIHFHLLLSAVPGAAPFDLVRLWKRLGGGYADVSPYDPARGAAWYLTKALARGGEIDVGGF